MITEYSIYLINYLTDFYKSYFQNVWQWLLVLVLLGSFPGCTNPEQKQQAVAKPPLTTEHKPVAEKREQTSKTEPVAQINLTALNGLPSEISGCSCYFSETEEDFKKQKFVFAHNYEGLAVISLANKVLRLKLVKTNRDSVSMSNRGYKEMYADETYTATISVTYKNPNGDETWWNEGVLTVNKKGAEPVTRKFRGECGC